jgi:hypothetical protein
VFDLVLGAFLAAALCLCAAGLFNGLWWFMREEAGEEAGPGRVHPNPFEFNSRNRWRQTRAFYAALFARDGNGRGERFRRLAKRSLISAGTMFVLFIALAVIDVARGA